MTTSIEAPRGANGRATAGRRLLRIEMVLPSLVAAGMEVLVARMVRALAARGHDVGVTCLESDGILAGPLRDEGFRVTVRETPGLTSIFHAPALDGWLRELHPDVVHVHSGAWLKGAGAARRAGVRRVIATVHGILAPEPWHGPALMHLAARRTDRVVAVSDSLSTYLHRRVRVPARKLDVILNGVDTTRFAPRPHPGRLRAQLGLPPEALLVGHVARLDPVKNQPMLLDAFARVRQVVPSAVLVMVGDGPMRAALERQIETLGLQEGVKLAGLHPDPSSLYPEFDAFALSSTIEGTSMSLLEAMATGVPVVATAVGGTPALLQDGRAGVLVPSDDAVAFAAALVGLLTDRERRAQVGAAGRRRVETTYSEGAMLDQYEALYHGAALPPQALPEGTCAA